MATRTNWCKLICHSLLLALLLKLPAAQGAVLVLSNEDRISGELISLGTDRLEWDSATLGRLTISRDHVQSLNGLPLPSAPAPVPAPAPSPARFSGEFDADIERNLGSTDNQEFESELDFRIELRQSEHELSLHFDYEANEDRVRREKYELNYLVKRYYRAGTAGPFVYGRGAWNKDRFRPLDEWRAFGGGAGFAWQPNKNLKLMLMIGLDDWRIRTDSDQTLTGTGGRLETGFLQQFPSLSNLAIFYDVEAIWRINGPTGRIINMSTGARMPISRNFYTELSADFDRYEVDSAIDTGLLGNDTEWNLKLGYQWDR